MSDSLTTLVNMSLQAIGQPAILNIDEPKNRAAREAALAWPDVRDEVHGEWDWNAFRRQASIPKLGTIPKFGFKFQYGLPEDAIKVWSVDEDYTRFHGEINAGGTAGRITGGSGNRITGGTYGSGTQFEVEDNKIKTNKDIITDLNVVNVPGLPVTYSIRVTDPSKYPTYLTPVFYYRLAMSICQSVTGDRTILSDVTAFYEKFFKKARARNAQEGQAGRLPGAFVGVRD